MLLERAKSKSCQNAILKLLQGLTIWSHWSRRFSSPKLLHDLSTKWWQRSAKLTLCKPSSNFSTTSAPTDRMVVPLLLPSVCVTCKRYLRCTWAGSAQHLAISNWLAGDFPLNTRYYLFQFLPPQSRVCSGLSSSLGRLCLCFVCTLVGAHNGFRKCVVRCVCRSFAPASQPASQPVARLPSMTSVQSFA